MDMLDEVSKVVFQTDLQHSQRRSTRRRSKRVKLIWKADATEDQRITELIKLGRKMEVSWAEAHRKQRMKQQIKSCFKLFLIL